MINYQTVKKCATNCELCVTKPCQLGCPLNNDITSFISYIKKKDYKNAYQEISKTNVLPAICGRICPHERQCVGSCVKGISFSPVDIGYLESVVGDLAIENNWHLKKTKKELKKHVAVVGSGPASLTCAAYLRMLGIKVTIYEKKENLGGLLRYGIPEYRLDKNVLDKTIKKILELNINVKVNQELGCDFTLQELQNKYDAIFLGIGANKGIDLNIPGEQLEGVYKSNEVLEYNNHPDYKDKKVVIIGAGNVAMDIARLIKKMGAKDVIIAYRKDKSSMPAEKKEITSALNDGIKFLYKTNIIKIHGTDKVEKIECVKTEIINEDNIVKVNNKPDSNFFIKCDYLFIAIGSKSDEELLTKLKIELNSKQKIKTDINLKTSINKVYAGGDVTGTTSTIAWAARSGRNAAYSIFNELTKK